MGNYDHFDLEAALMKKKISRKAVASAIGITTQSLKKKLDSKIPFRDFEIMRILKLMDEDNPEQIKHYFFTEEK